MDIKILLTASEHGEEPKDKAEEVAVKMLEENKDSVVVCVLDASKIERGLYLTLEVIERGYPVAVALNMWDDAHAKKIDIDVKKLETILGVPVVPTIATTNEGLMELVSRIGDAATIEIDDIIEKANPISKE